MRLPSPAVAERSETDVSQVILFSANGTQLGTGGKETPKSGIHGGFFHVSCFGTLSKNGNFPKTSAEVWDLPCG
jgi:hypothetical protein